MSKLFAQMKKNQDDSLQEILNADKPKYQNEDDDARFWKCSQDKQGNGSATIRFLPASANSKLPWVKMYSHGFQSESGKWYIEKSLTTIDEKDPITEANDVLWKMGEGSVGRRLVSGVDGKNARKRKLSYYANVYIVNDPANPENNGTVRIFKFGAKIHDKIMGKLKPVYEGVAPSRVYDFWTGSNFQLRMKKVNKQTNYDDSEWDSPSALLGGDDAKLEALWMSQHNLDELVSRDKFKTYDELKKRFMDVVGNDDPAVIRLGWASGTTGFSARPTQSEDAPEPSRSLPPKAQPSVSNASDDDELPWKDDGATESAEDFFASLDD